MGGKEFSRRDFLRGAGAVGLASGALGVFGTTGFAFADDAESPEEAASIYQTIIPGETTLLPLKKAECPGPRGPIAYEDREIAASEISSTEECDVLVVGAGIAGLTAALKAAEEGARVMCIEKMTKGRGCFECFGAYNAQAQKDAGVEVDPAQLLDEIYRSAYWRTRPEPARTYVFRSGEATDFWQQMLDKGENGFVITKVEQAPNTNGMPLIDSELGFYDSPSLPPDAGVRSGLSGIYVCREMAEVANQYDNLDIRYSTPAVQLTRDGSGRITGAVAKAGEEYVQINAAKGVILATGSYDANPEMMQAWVRPEDYATSSWWNPGWGTTGDGHMMGLRVGANMDSLPHPVMNFRWGNPDSFYDARVWTAIWLAINVNAKGMRYVNEDLPFQAVSNAQNAQPGFGANCWQIFDDGMLGASEEEIAGAKEAMDEFIEKGWAFSASTPRELAEKCGIDPDGLEETIGLWNGYWDGKKDMDFNRFMESTAPFAGQTIYALTTNSCILATGGGLMIDGSCRVLDTEDNVIEGLYAVGNVSGSFFAGNYPRHIPGTSIGRAVTFGFVAAEHAVKGA